MICDSMLPKPSILQKLFTDELKFTDELNLDLTLHIIDELHLKMCIHVPKDNEGN